MAVLGPAEMDVPVASGAKLTGTRNLLEHTTTVHSSFHAGLSPPGSATFPVSMNWVSAKYRPPQFVSWPAAPISYIKANAAEVLADLESRRQPVIITQNGEGKAVLQDVASYEETQETLALLKILALGGSTFCRVVASRHLPPTSLRPTRPEYVLERLITTTDSPRVAPARGTPVKELRIVGLAEYRQVFFKPYRFIYRTFGSRVIIYMTADGRRDMQALLLRRLLLV